MSKENTTNKTFVSGVISDEEAKLILEINDLVRLRSAISFGTTTSLKQSAESAISRKITAKVSELSKLVLVNHSE